MVCFRTIGMVSEESNYQGKGVEKSASDEIQAVSAARFDDSSTEITLPDIDADWDEPTHSPWAGARWILGSGLVALVGLAGWWGYERFLKAPPEPIAVTTAPVGRSDLAVITTASGTVELGGQQTFKAPDDVTVQAVFVEERQAVAQGQVLLELRNRTLQRDLDDLLVENRINQLDLQRRQEVLVEKQSRLADAEARLKDSADLLAQGFISEDEYRRDQREFESAQSEVRDAEVDVTKAAFQVQQNESAVNNLKVELADNRIVSPMDAVVLKVDVQAGDGVQREGRLLSIGDPNQETIRLQLLPLDAAKVGIGMPVRVSVIGPNPDIFEGRVTRVSPQAIAQSDESGQSTVEAEARLTRPSNFLIPGSAVSVEIILEARPNALSVPVSAIQREAEQPFVWVKDAAGLAQQRQVTLGLETLQAVEITAGLQEGDEIVVLLPPEVTLSPGDPLGSSGADNSAPSDAAPGE